MSELVLNGTRTGEISLSGLWQILKSKIHYSIHRKTSTSELIFLTLTLTFLQLLDGILTGVGVINFGPEIEANSIIRFLIESWGVIPALLTVKAFALLVIIALCSMVPKVTWLAAAMKAIIVLYIFAAIIPWTMILSFQIS